MLLLLIGSSVILCASKSTVAVIVVVNETDSTMLVCEQLSEDHQVSYEHVIWRKDGKVLRQTSLGKTSDKDGFLGSQTVDSLVHEKHRIVLNKQNGSLIFHKVIAKDSGSYTCEVESIGGETFSSGIIDLKIKESLKFMPQPTSKNLELGTIAKVHCKAQGTPPPRIEWLMDESLALPFDVSNLNGTLIFHNVSFEQRGNYTCIAFNIQEKINTTVAINVVVAPKFRVIPVRPTEIADTESVFMHCQATGYPKPTIQWDKNLKYLNENNTDKGRIYFHSNGTLEIRGVNVDDEGYYGCTIGSSAGLKREEVFLTVHNKFNSLVSRIIVIVICLAFLYFVLILGLKICCRNRRQLRKINLNDVEHREKGAGCEDEAEESKLWLANPSFNQNSNIAKKTKLCESAIIDDVV